MLTPTVDRILVALKDRFKEALKVTKMSALKVDRIVVALKAKVDRNINYNC